MDSTVMHNLRSVQSQSVEDKTDTLKFERMNARYLSIRPGLARSCEWLYDRVEYVSWRNRDMIKKHHGCLWIKGKPGSGKSTLMKTAVDKEISSHTSSATISHFFYRGGGDLEASAGKMYQSLLYQLLEQLPRLKSVLDILTTTNLQQGEWPIELLESIFRTAVLQLRGNDTVTCYIDALDECDDREARNIIGFFEDLTDATVEGGVPFRFCVSSRHYPNITMTKCLRLILDHQDGHAEDISRYANSKLRLTSPDQKRQLIKRICEKASGVFLWVKFVVEELNIESDNGNSHMLQNCLDGIPSELPAIFDRIVRKDARHDPAFIPTLQWVLFSRVPLKRVELYCAVRARLGSIETGFKASNIDMERFIMRSSKGFVELVEDIQPTFRFIHETVRDYFASAGLAALDSTLNDNMSAQSHHQLMQCCQDYLGRVMLKESSLPFQVPRAHSKQARDVRIKIVEQHPFLEYALSGILYHADVALSCGVSQYNFLETFPFDKWTLLKDATEMFQRGRYKNRHGRRWILAEQGASFLLELDLQVHPQSQFEARKYQSILGVAVERERARSVEVLLEYGADADSIGWGNESCLHLAVKQGVVRITKALLASGASVTPTILLAAVQTGDLEIFRAVFGSRPIDGSCSQNYGELLWLASYHGDLAIAKLLLDQGIDVDTMTRNEHALQAASANGHIAMFDLLLEHGADVNIHANRALLAASEGGHAALVRKILGHGANVDATHGQKGTALYVACEESHEGVVSVLLESGADVNGEAGYYGSALYAASISGREKLVKMLLAYGARVNATGRGMSTALCGASHMGLGRVVEVLLESGADVNYCGPTGSALQAAVFSTQSFEYLGYHSEVRQMLIDAGANVNLQGGKYGNALQTACAMRCRDHACTGDLGYYLPGEPCRSDVVRLLLQEGAQINAPGGYFGNALQAACACSCKNVVRLLLDNNADPIAEGGHHGNIEATVEWRIRQSQAIGPDIAAMVSAARTKTLDRSAALSSRSPAVISPQVSEANR